MPGIVVSTLMTLVLLASLPGCGGELVSALPSLPQLQVGRSTAVGVRRLDAVLSGIRDIALATGESQVLPGGNFYDPDTGAFTIEIDTDGDLLPDSTLSGVLASAHDISDGIDPGEFADAGWVLIGKVFGDGDTRIRGTGPERFLLTGTAELADAIEFSFDVTNISMELDESDFPLDGSLDYLAGSLDLETMDGELFYNGTERVTGTGEFEGEELTFDIKLDTYQVIFKL